MMKQWLIISLLLAMAPPVPAVAQKMITTKIVSPVGRWRMENCVYAFDSKGSGMMTLGKKTTPLRWKQDAKGIVNLELLHKDGGRTDQSGTVSPNGQTLKITRQRIRNGLVPALEKGKFSSITLTFNRE